MLHGTGCAGAEEPEAVGASGTPLPSLLAPAPGPRRLLRRLLRRLRRHPTSSVVPSAARGPRHRVALVEQE